MACKMCKIRVMLNNYLLENNIDTINDDDFCDFLPPCKCGDCGKVDNNNIICIHGYDQYYYQSSHKCSCFSNIKCKCKKYLRMK